MKVKCGKCGKSISAHTATIVPRESMGDIPRANRTFCRPCYDKWFESQHIKSDSHIDALFAYLNLKQLNMFGDGE